MIIEYQEEFLFPEYIFEEIEEHKQELFNKSRLSQEEYDLLLNKILSKVKIVKTSEIIKYREEALSIMNKIDADDALFIACALAYPDSAIWSDDKRLKKQNKIRIFSTSEMMSYLSKKDF